LSELRRRLLRNNEHLDARQSRLKAAAARIGRPTILQNPKSEKTLCINLQRAGFQPTNAGEIAGMAS